MTSRLLKQILIASVFFLIVGSIVYFSFSQKFSSSVLSPTPLIKPPEVVSQKLFKIDNFDYDFLVEIKNPNFDFGAADVIYELKFFNGANKLISVQSGSIYLFPGQTRYEVISPIAANQEISNATFQIINANWQKLEAFVPQTLFVIRSKEYLALSSGQGFSKLKGTLFNNSNFNFDRVDVHLILYDKDNNPIAVSRTDIRTIKAKTDRFFEAKWVKPFPGEVSRIEVYPYTNVFKNENFIKEYGVPEQFQKFY